MPLPHQQDLAKTRWTVRLVGDLSHVPASLKNLCVAATVPGCIHTDLIDAGVIRDPRIGDAEDEIQWMSWTDWRYETEFDADPALFDRDEIDLAFDSLDTIAVIELNGVEVGRAASEFLPWRFSVRDVLVPGKNHLAVTFTSPLRYVQQEAARLGPRPVNGDYPAYNTIRKCASNFEWDWGPRVATCGIAGDVRLEAWDTARLAHVNSTTRRFDRDHWDVRVLVQIARTSSSLSAPLLVAIELLVGGEKYSFDQLLLPDDSSCTLQFTVRRPPLWAACTQGEQPTFLLRLTLTHDEDTVPLSEVVCRIAFREIRLDTKQDQHGSRFTVILNDQPIYCRGANWIPEGLFPRDRTPERVRKRLEQLKAANMNMVRVWGGGRYEPDWFYDICDELGIMVWQDFMFACACYPEEEPLRSLIDQEARHHVARLSRHPSVILWCGGNECEWAHESWGFKKKLAPGQTWGQKYYREILPRICAEVNPTIPYISNSPSSLAAGMHPNNPAHGDTHTWEVWGEGYRSVTPRFCSEFGQQGPSNIATLKKAGLTPLAEARGSDAIMPSMLARRQRGPGGNKRWYDDPISTWFRPPRDFDEWHYLAQLLQARSLQIGIEWQRANMPHCMGSLIWQINDAWPGLSWSLIDSHGKPKLAYHSVAAAFKNRKLTIQPFDGVLYVVGINDTDKQWTSKLRVRRMSFDAVRCVDADALPFSIPPRSIGHLCRLDEIVGPPEHPDQEFVVAENPRHRAFWFYLPDRELCYPEPDFVAEVNQTKNGYLALILTPRVLMRDVVIQADRVLTNALPIQPPPHTVLPGEKLFVALTRRASTADVDAKCLTSRPVFWCANDFGKPTDA